MRRFRLPGLFAIILTLSLVMLPVRFAFAQTPAAGGGTGEALRVMTYNIHHGAGNDDCVDPETEEGQIPESECALDLGRIATVIEGQTPAVVGLQEVDRFWARSGGADQPQELADMLGMDVCYGANLDHAPDDHADEQHEYGVAILSVYPIESCENTFLPTTEGWEQRGLLDARIDLPGLGEVAILNTHFQSNASGEADEAANQRTQQADAVAEYVADIDLPVILMGDFNAEPVDDELASLADEESGLTDAWSVVYDGSEGLTRPSHPEEDPVERIDLIFLTDEFTATFTEVVIDQVTRMASDHYPVISDLDVGNQATPTASPVTS